MELWPSRRSVLLGLAASLLAGGAMANPRPRLVNVVNAHTGARFRGIYAVDRDYYAGPLDRFSEIAKDHHANKTRRMHPYCLDLIWIYQTVLKLPEVVLLSGYRSPETNAKTEGAARNSFHMRGMALDFAVPKTVALKPLGKMMQEMIGGGVGLYHAKEFIHLDIGPQRNWEK